MEHMTDDKYIVFKRDEFEKYVLNAEEHYTEWELQDAVVIRRQDKFASPALATYAAMIGMVALMHPVKEVRDDLLRISDYFEDQAKLAAEEGHKLPDL